MKKEAGVGMGEQGGGQWRAWWRGACLPGLMPAAVDEGRDGAMGGAVEKWRGGTFGKQT